MQITKKSELEMILDGVKLLEELDAEARYPKGQLLKLKGRLIEHWNK